MVFGRRKFTSSSTPNDATPTQDITLPGALQVTDPTEIEGKRNNHNAYDDLDDDEEEDMEQAPKTSSVLASSSSTFSIRTPSSSSSSQQSQLMLAENYKFGILERLNDAVALKLTLSTTASRRSPDLIPLMKSFDLMRKKLRQMIVTTKKYHQSMMNLDSDRIQMAKEIASFADGTPMKDAVNKVDDQLSFISVFHNTSNVSAKNSFKYKNDVMAYCIEWESVVSTRVDKDVLDIKKLREMFNHYQDKVDSLRKKVNGQETKGKSINAALSEKLQRNEEKLDEASGLYEASARPLCVLIEEVVQYGYKDLFPFIVAIMKFEMERSQNESRALHLFQCEAFENEFGPNSTSKGSTTNNQTRASSSSNPKNKQPDSNPKKVLKKKISSRVLSSANNTKRGKNNTNKPSKATAAVNVKQEPVDISNPNQNNDKPQHKNEEQQDDSESSSSASDENLSAKVEAV